MSAALVACVDVGSTFTKAALVERGTGRLVATAEHPTTSATDVMEGWYACLDALRASEPAAAGAEVLACSSAGGGLRVAVVGHEELVTAEAGRRVALSSGGRVVAVVAGGLPDAAAVAGLAATEPDVVLLVGGTDGGDHQTVRTAAASLAAAGWDRPVVVAGNREATPEVARALADAGVPHATADNVVPRIGVLAPSSARTAVRELFLAHVIGGKHLSTDPAFVDLVRGPTPDVVLDAVELLARGVPAEGLPGAGDVVVVDVGGATTDVHAFTEPDPEDSSASGLHREVVATPPLGRTVEGDLGMRWSAVGVVEAASAAGDLDPDDPLDAALPEAAAARQADPGLLPADAGEEALDERIATLAVTHALRRHAGRARVAYDAGGRLVERTGRDLREVDLLVGSGGALRHVPLAVATRVLAAACTPGGGWQLPERPRVVVDASYVLAAAGLLAADDPVTAHRLMSAHLLGA